MAIGFFGIANADPRDNLTKARERALTLKLFDEIAVAAPLRTFEHGQSPDVPAMKLAGETGDLILAMDESGALQCTFARARKRWRSPSMESARDECRELVAGILNGSRAVAQYWTDKAFLGAAFQVQSNDNWVIIERPSMRTAWRIASASHKRIVTFEPA